MKRAAEESSRGLEKKNPSSTPEEENKSSSTASKKEEEDRKLKVARLSNLSSSPPLSSSTGEHDLGEDAAVSTDTGKEGPAPASRISKEEANRAHEEEENRLAPSSDPPVRFPEEANQLSSPNAHTERTSRNQTAPVPFPVQIMKLLQQNVAPGALWFLEGGEGIGMNRNLIDGVLNVHIRGMKFNSLVRNLNRWGFRRVSHQSLKKNELGFHHLLFQRDKPHLVYRIKKDSDAKEVMRQLDMEEGKTGDQHNYKSKANTRPRDGNPGLSSQATVETKTEESLAPLSSAHQPAQSAPRTSHLSEGVQGHLPFSLSSGSIYQRQQSWQGPSALQLLQWQRQQAVLAQMGASQSIGSNNFANWGMQQALPATRSLATASPPQQELYPVVGSTRAAQQAANLSHDPSIGKSAQNSSPAAKAEQDDASREANASSPGF